MTADRKPIRAEDLLSVTVLHPEGGRAVELLDTVGEVDLLSARLLEDAVTAALSRAPALLVVDLTGVTYLASSGISVLLKACAGHGPRMRIVAPEGSVVERALRLAGLEAALGVAATRAEALSP